MIRCSSTLSCNPSASDKKIAIVTLRFRTSRCGILGCKSSTLLLTKLSWFVCRMAAYFPVRPSVKPVCLAGPAQTWLPALGARRSALREGCDAAMRAGGAAPPRPYGRHAHSGPLRAAWHGTTTRKVVARAGVAHPQGLIPIVCYKIAASAIESQEGRWLTERTVSAEEHAARSEKMPSLWTISW